MPKSRGSKTWWGRLRSWLVGLKGWIVAVTTLVVAVGSLLKEVHNVWPPAKPDQSVEVVPDPAKSSTAPGDRVHKGGQGEDATVTQNSGDARLADEQRVANEKVVAERLAKEAAAREAAEEERQKKIVESRKLQARNDAFNAAYGKVQGSWVWTEHRSRILFNNTNKGKCKISTQNERHLSFASALFGQGMTGTFTETEQLEAGYTPPDRESAFSLGAEQECNGATTGDINMGGRVLEKSGSFKASQDPDNTDSFAVTTIVTSCTLNSEDCPESEDEDEDLGSFSADDSDILKIGYDVYHRGDRR